MSLIFPQGVTSIAPQLSDYALLGRGSQAGKSTLATIGSLIRNAGRLPLTLKELGNVITTPPLRSAGESFDVSSNELDPEILVPLAQVRLEYASEEFALYYKGKHYAWQQYSYTSTEPVFDGEYRVCLFLVTDRYIDPSLEGAVEFDYDGSKFWFGYDNGRLTILRTFGTTELYGYVSNGPSGTELPCLMIQKQGNVDIYPISSSGAIGPKIKPLKTFFPAIGAKVWLPEAPLPALACYYDYVFVEDIISQLLYLAKH